MSKSSKEKWFKRYDKIYNQINKYEEKPMILKQDLFGIELKVERYPPTWCIWKQLIYYKKDKEVYRLTKDNEIRKECFFKEKTPFREWKGDKFCFVEYLHFIKKIKTWPDLNEVISKFGLDKKIAKRYSSAILQIKLL